MHVCVVVQASKSNDLCLHCYNVAIFSIKEHDNDNASTFHLRFPMRSGKYDVMVAVQNVSTLQKYQNIDCLPAVNM